MDLLVKCDYYGNILETTGGSSVTVDTEYDYFFSGLDKETLLNIHEYKIQDGDLVLK